ncbi:pantoate--beta-alanine ligase [Campylobacter sp.]|uniref:pantoate--beta-alanine ligase n=1 Tax=Campylobacter sp. TaxID=205 RepID=UPI0027082F23|nr:pantoate--beta-alanine ligase [Campylobacter sp.]
MQIFRKVSELREFINLVNPDIGFVPTMGALHDGHVSLIKKCVSENETSIVSTFVNPTQFLPNEDLDAYPRNEGRDIEICRQCGVDVMFIPTANELYFKNELIITAPANLASILEGATRPGHFDGVLRVLNKLFNITCAKRAYFGKKDAQQLAIVQNMVRTNFMNLEIIPCEIVRESSGLALSSRNAYLSSEERQDALKISSALMHASNLIKNKRLAAKEIKAEMVEILKPLKVDYVAVVDRGFKEIPRVELKNSIILIAVYVGKTRLIDNIWV